MKASLTIPPLVVFLILSASTPLSAEEKGPSTSPVRSALAMRTPEVMLGQYIRFDSLTTEDGLSNNAIWGIAQDSHDFMWFATYSGLNRYDGSDFKVYRHDPDDPNSISHDAMRGLIVDRSGVLWIGTWGGGLNRYDGETERFSSYRNNPADPGSISNDNVRTVFEDRGGMIWVGTIGGLNKLDPTTMQFTRYMHNPDDLSSLQNNIVWSVYEDREGILWLGTEGGLDRFNPETGKFVHYRHDPDDPHSLNNNSVRSICEDGSGALWVGTMEGLHKFNRETEQFTRYQHDSANPDSLSHNVIFLVYTDKAGNLWIGTWGGGLDRFDPETETFVHHRSNPADTFSLSADNIYLIFEDQSGMFWIGTEDGGINILDRGGKPFRHYRSIPGNPTSLSHNGVRSIYEDRSGVLWVGTTSGGLNKLDPQTEEFTHYRHKPGDPDSLSNDSVMAIHEDQKGVLWVGGFGSGLNRFDQDTESFTHYIHDSENAHSLSNNAVVSIYEDRSGKLWIGTWGGGLNAFNRETEQFIRYMHSPKDSTTLSHNQVISIYEDQSGKLWVGTVVGLNKYNRETKTFTRYQHVSSDPKSLGQNSVVAMYEDRSGTFWIGTTGGLDKFDREREQFIHYTMQDGLPSNLVFGILEDERGNLWLSTPSGISKFNPKTEIFRNYDVSDGLQGNTFMTFNAYHKTQSGELLFGGANGFNAFYPNQIKDNPFIPPVLITDFQLANRPVPIGSDSVLQKSIIETDHLVLSYLDLVFSFGFAALTFRVPEKNLYRYKMEGFEDDWNEVDGTRRFATYTNLDPGDYVFRVIGSNNDGIWNEKGASIRITVTPPWWETSWFRISMGVVAIGLLIGGYRWRVSTIKARSRELEREVKKRTQELQIAKEAAEAASLAKSQFLSNMSHELRTPLTAILGFSQLLGRDQDLNQQQQERFGIINRSGGHLLGMIDKILSLSKIEAGRVELKQETFSLVQMLQDIGQIMKSRAEGKGLEFNLELDSELCSNMQGDAGKIRQVMINLLGNAIKFTIEGGASLRARSQPMADDPSRAILWLEVEDTGPGIPPDQLDRIFESFTQVAQSPQTDKGVGLGLSITKEFVEMMDGEILVQSEPGRGALFTVKIPLLLPHETTATPAGEPAGEVIGLEPGQPGWRILVADDNPENRLLLTAMLTQVGFSVKEADNGEEAITKFQEWYPHFIWIDMRMPVMDGYTATKKIRELPGGGEVKIVAATASVLEEDREEILASGCDALVHKPFQDHEIFDAMARQLGVKYLYKDGVAEPAQKQGINLTAEMLAELPVELLQELQETTLALNREAMLEVIERIEEYVPDTAEGLRALVQDFQMGRIRELLGKVG